MSKLEELKVLVRQIHALGENEALDVEDYAELVMQKAEEAAALLPQIPDFTDMPELSADESEALRQVVERIQRRNKEAGEA